MRKSLKAEQFIEAKYGKDVIVNIDGYKIKDPEIRFGGNLENVLEEFAAIIRCKDIAQMQNPRSKQWTVVDREQGKIICNLQNPVKFEK